jgi:hypothetical protein
MLAMKALSAVRFCPRPGPPPVDASSGGAPNDGDDDDVGIVGWAVDMMWSRLLWLSKHKN